MEKAKNPINEKGLEIIPSSPRVTDRNPKNLNKAISISKQKNAEQRILTLQSRKSERVRTSPQTSQIKTTEIITLNTEHIESPSLKFLTNNKIYFKNYSQYDQAKYSNKPYGSIAGYGVNTNQGQVRNYNEDRVSIILNVIKPNSRQGEEWPKVSFFGIYDGHGGNKCSDFLKENLHHYVCSKIKENKF